MKIDRNKLVSKKPLISVIIPTFNRETLLKRAIISVLNQTYQNLEIVIIDDASKDGTEKLVNNFQDSRINYFKNDRNQGVQISRNRGLEIAKGLFISFLDDDDFWLKEKIEEQYKKFEETKGIHKIINVGYFNISRHENKANTVDIVSAPNEGHLFFDLLEENFIADPLIYRECFETSGFFVMYVCATSKKSGSAIASSSRKETTSPCDSRIPRFLAYDNP